MLHHYCLITVINVDKGCSCLDMGSFVGSGDSLVEIEPIDPLFTSTLRMPMKNFICCCMAPWVDIDMSNLDLGQFVAI